MKHQGRWFDRFLAAGLAALVLVCGGASAQITKRGKAYEFRAKYVKGSKVTFDFTTAVTQFQSASGVSKEQTITFPATQTSRSNSAQ